VRSGELSYQQVLPQRLRLMDGIAISQCIEPGMLILVFNYSATAASSGWDRHVHCRQPAFGR
jgi:uridylate kinase